jgi:nucleoid DNA-binding protein
MASVVEVAKKAGVSEDIALRVFEELVDLTRRGQRVYIRNFGSFFLKQRASRVVRSPALPGGEARVVPRTVLEFKPSRKLNGVFNGRALGVVGKPIGRK